MLQAFLRPTAGRYLLDERDTDSIPVEEIRRRIAWCPQEAHLFDSSLRANLLLARSRDDAPAERDMIGVLEQVGLAPLLTDLPDGLDTRIGSRGSHLSGGQRQRVAIARTLLTNAGVLLIDEPAAHLDRASADVLLRDLRTALPDKIVVLVTHHLDDLASTNKGVSISRNVAIRNGDTTRNSGDGDRVVNAHSGDIAHRIAGSPEIPILQKRAESLRP